jgi:DNA-binding response OmpR family regulator
MKILLVEDDKNISEMVCDYLEGESYEVIQVYDGNEAIHKFEKDKYDAALVDLMLPSSSGLEVIKAIRATSMIPIIIITAKDSDVDKAMGLNLGADDYVTKPFSIIELSARIKANIRRATKYNHIETEKNSIISIKDLEINITQYQVKRNEELLNLTHTEFEILRLLASNPGRAFSKEQIYNLIWKEPYYGNESVLNTHMNRLRSKLRIEKEDTEYIKTLWGIGYKMEED